MFTQFFGNYLLNNGYITISQLVEALDLQKTVKLKLGVLAINAGYMTASQVDKVHKMQSKIDKRFGTIAIEMGYLTDEQVEELLKSQKTGYLLLGQALVDKCYMTNDQFQSAIENYKKEHKIKDADFSLIQNEKMLEIIEDFYDFDSFEDAALYTEYISLLFKNLVRFVGDDFTPLKSNKFEEFECRNFTSQTIEGEFNIYSALECDDDTFVKFASRFSQELYTENDEYTKASVSEFMNLNNGIFCVNMSNTNRMELELTPQNIDSNKKLTKVRNAFCIPIRFTFGTVNFLIIGNMPTII